MEIENSIYIELLLAIRQLINAAQNSTCSSQSIDRVIAILRRIEEEK